MEGLDGPKQRTIKLLEAITSSATIDEVHTVRVDGGDAELRVGKRYTLDSLLFLLL